MIAKVESPAILIRSSGSICTATRRLMAAPRARRLSPLPDVGEVRGQRPGRRRSRRSERRRRRACSAARGARRRRDPAQALSSSAKLPLRCARLDLDEGERAPRRRRCRLRRRAPARRARMRQPLSRRYQQASVSAPRPRFSAACRFIWSARARGRRRACAACRAAPRPPPRRAKATGASSASSSAASSSSSLAAAASGGGPTTITISPLGAAVGIALRRVRRACR